MRTAVALGLLALLLLSGCGDEPVDIDWDLTRSHTMADVTWPSPDLDATAIEEVGSVRIALPGEERVTAEPGLGRGVIMAREGEVVTEVAVTTGKRPVDEAAALARRYAEQFELPLEPIEEWRRKALRDPTATGFTADAGAPLGGPGGPEVTVELRFSFDREQPTVVGVVFGWPSPTLERLREQGRVQP